MNYTEQNKKEILQKLYQNRKKMIQLGVSKLGLFGSFKDNAQTAESDIDLLVEFETEKKTFKNYMALSFLLEDLFQREVELLTKESLSPHIGPHILKNIEYVSLRN